MTDLSIISVELHMVYSHNQIFSSRKCLHQKPFVSGRDSDGNGEFFIDRITGVIRTKVSLDHEEKSMYRLSVAATDNGHPPKQTIRMLRVEVLDLNDNRPTFTSSSLVFQVRLFCRLLCFQYILPKSIIILFTSLTRRACACLSIFSGNFYATCSRMSARACANSNPREANFILHSASK